MFTITCFLVFEAGVNHNTTTYNELYWLRLVLILNILINNLIWIRDISIGFFFVCSQIEFQMEFDRNEVIRTDSF